MDAGELVRATKLRGGDGGGHEHLEGTDVAADQARGAPRLRLGDGDAVQRSKVGHAREDVRAVVRELRQRGELEGERLEVRTRVRERVELRHVVDGVIRRREESELGELREGREGAETVVGDVEALAAVVGGGDVVDDAEALVDGGDAAFLGVERGGLVAEELTEAHGAGETRADRGGGVAVAGGGDGGEVAARGDGGVDVASRGDQARRGSRDGTARVLAAGLRLGPAPNLGEGRRGVATTRPTAVPGGSLEPVGGLRATTGGGGAAGPARRRDVARLVATTRLARVILGRVDHLPGPRRVPARVSPHEPRAGRRRALALVERGVPAEDAHVHDVLRHGRRASPPPRGAQTNLNAQLTPTASNVVGTRVPV